MEEPKYRVEYNKPTTGGVEGYSVRAAGDVMAEVLHDASELRRAARREIET